MGRHRKARRTKRMKRMCRDKHAYRTELQAMRVGARWHQDWYRCPYCHMWHLTSKNTQPLENGQRDED